MTHREKLSRTRRRGEANVRIARALLLALPPIPGVERPFEASLLHPRESRRTTRSAPMALHDRKTRLINWKWEK